MKLIECLRADFRIVRRKIESLETCGWIPGGIYRSYGKSAKTTIEGI